MDRMRVSKGPAVQRITAVQKQTAHRREAELIDF